MMKQSKKNRKSIVFYYRKKPKVGKLPQREFLPLWIDGLSREENRTQDTNEAIF